MNKISFIAGYGRLSTLTQAGVLTREQQEQRLKEAGAEKIYFDIKSGRRTNRQALDNLLDDARNGKIYKVIFAYVDRLGRNDVYTMGVIDELLTLKIKLFFIDLSYLGEISEDNPHSRMTLWNAVGFADFQSRLQANKIQTAKSQQKDMNLPLGNVPAFGYQIQKETNFRSYVLDKRPVLSPNGNTTRASIARELVDLFIQEQNAAKVIRTLIQKYSREVNFPKNETSLKNWLMNPVLRGHIAYNMSKKQGGKRVFIHPQEWDLRKDVHPEHRLISEEEFKLIESIINANQRQRGAALQHRGRDSKGRLHLSGLVFCPVCSSKFSFRTGNGGQYLYCRNSNKDCSNKATIRADVADNQLIYHIFQKAQEPREMPKTIESDELNVLQKRLQKTILLLQEDPTDTMLLEWKAKYEKEIEEQKKILSKREVWDLEASEIMSHPNMKRLNFLYSFSNDKRRLIYCKIIDCIFIFNGQVIEVKFKI